VAKKVIIINGPGGVGKDFFVSLVKEFYETPEYRIENVSSIDPVKRALRKHFGWDGETKNDEWRRKMVELHQKYISYNLPLQYLIRRINQVEHGLIFLHIREPEEIQKIKERISEAITTHMSRNQVITPDTTADKYTRNYDYDYYIRNNGDEIDLEILVEIFFENDLKEFKSFDYHVSV
jgi:hypothetical protein